MYKVEVIMVNKYKSGRDIIISFFLTMRRVNFNFLTSILIVLIVFFYIFKLDLHNTTTKIHCSAYLNIHKEDFYAQVRIMYSIQGEYGVVFIDGDIYKNRNVIGFISQRASFDVKRINDILLLTSNNTWTSEVNNIDESLFKGVLPLFYTQKGNHATIHFTQKTPYYYDVSTKIIPSMYCAVITT